MSDPYWRMFGREWDDGTNALTLEQEAALLRICNAINSRGKPIPNDDAGDRDMMHRCRVSMRKWKALKSALVAAGKITIRDAQIHQIKALDEVKYRQDQQRQLAENGAKGGRKKAENALKNARKPAENTLKTERKRTEYDAELNENKALILANKEPELDIDKDTSVSSPKPPNLDAHEAIRIFRELCVDGGGLPDVRKLTDLRRKSLTARLRDGGLDDWRQVCQKVSSSAFLRGEEGGWSATFDWIVNPQNYQKILEGNYDKTRCTASARATSNRYQAATDTRRIALLQAALEAEGGGGEECPSEQFDQGYDGPRGANITLAYSCNAT